MIHCVCLESHWNQYLPLTRNRESAIADRNFVREVRTLEEVTPRPSKSLMSVKHNTEN